jgi:hypothetical protein
MPHHQEGRDHSRPSFCAKHTFFSGWWISIFAGVFKKPARTPWFFDGATVVECVHNVALKRTFLRGENHATRFNFIFAVPPSRTGQPRMAALTLVLPSSLGLLS